MGTATLEPRVVSTLTLDEEELMKGFSFEDLDIFDPQAIARRTCNFGFTVYCDSNGSGGTCTYGWTFKCDAVRQ